MVFTEDSACQFDHGAAVDVGITRTPSSSMYEENAWDLASPPSWSERRIEGAPKGLMIISNMACCKCSVERDLIGVSWIKPVNKLTASRITV